MNLAVRHILPASKTSEITKLISGYFKNDIWDADDPVFNEFRKSEWGKTHRKINFTVFSSKLKNESQVFHFESYSK